MTLLVRCDKGHAYWQADVCFDGWPKGMPICPECAKEWLAGRREQPEGSAEMKDERCIALWLSLDVVMPHVGQRVLLRTVNSYDSVQQHIAALEYGPNGHSYFWRADKDAIVDQVIGWWPLPKREGTL